MAQRLKALAVLLEVLGAGDMVQHIRVLVVVLKFDSQPPHVGSQTSIMGSDGLFWDAGIHADRVLT